MGSSVLELQSGGRRQHWQHSGPRGAVVAPGCLLLAPTPAHTLHIVQKGEFKGCTVRSVLSVPYGPSEPISLKMLRCIHPREARGDPNSILPSLPSLSFELPTPYAPSSPLCVSEQAGRGTTSKLSSRAILLPCHFLCFPRVPTSNDLCHAAGSKSSRNPVNQKC